MASAEREPTRAPARVESESVRDQHLEAGGCILSPAFWRFHRAEVAQDPAYRLAGFDAALRGCNCAYPSWVHDFIKDAAQRARAQVGEEDVAVRIAGLEAVLVDIFERCPETLAADLAANGLEWPRSSDIEDDDTPESGFRCLMSIEAADESPRRSGGWPVGSGVRPSEAAPVPIGRQRPQVRLPCCPDFVAALAH